MLTPDVSAIQEAVACQATVTKAICAYMLAILRIPLAPQPIQVEGVNGSVDPFLDLPSLKDALSAARTHILAFGGTVMEPLHTWALQTVPDFNDTFRLRSNQILTILKEVGSGTPTPAQRQAVLESLTVLACGLAAGHAQVAGVRQAQRTFLREFAEDHRTLTVGENSLVPNIKAISDAITAEIAKYALGPLGAGIAAVAAEIGGRTADALQNTADLLDTAAGAADRMDAAFSDLETVVETLCQKYSGIVREVDEASDEDFGCVLQRLEITTAQVAWKQLADYVSTAGL